MDFELIIYGCIILVLGSMLQSAAGFAFGMFAIPLLIFFGFESYEAIAMISFCGAVQTVIGVYSLRWHVDWKQVAQLIVISLITVPLGVWVLSLLAEFGNDRVKQVFGAIIFVSLCVQILWKVRQHERLHAAWGWLAGALGGFFGGVAGMGGPPVVMWVHAHTWSNQRSRATLWAYFTGLTPIQIVILYLNFGDNVVTAVGTAAVLSPVMLLGILPGLWIGHRIPKLQLRQISFAIIFLISIYAMIEPPMRNLFNGAGRSAFHEPPEVTAVLAPDT